MEPLHGRRFLISEIQKLAHLNCVEFIIKIVPRSCNSKVAHELVTLGCVCLMTAECADSE